MVNKQLNSIYIQQSTEYLFLYALRIENAQQNK